VNQTLINKIADKARQEKTGRSIDTLMERLQLISH
jgi:hypothetical protein